MRRDQKLDLAVKSAVEDLLAVIRVDLHGLLVVDVYSAALDLQIVVGHGKADVSLFFAILAVQVQSVHVLLREVVEEKADMTAVFKYALQVLCEHVVEAALGLGTACIDDDKSGIRYRRALIVAHEPYIGKHFVLVLEFAHHVLVIVPSCFAKIVKSQVGYNGHIFHLYTRNADLLSIGRDRKVHGIAVLFHRAHEICNFFAVFGVETDPGRRLVIKHRRHLSALGRLHFVDRKARAERIELFLLIHHVDGSSAIVSYSRYFAADADDGLIHLIGDAPLDVSAGVRADCAVGPVLQDIAVKVDADCPLFRDKVSDLDDFRAVIVPVRHVQQCQKDRNDRNDRGKKLIRPDSCPVTPYLFLITQFRTAVCVFLPAEGISEAYQRLFVIVILVPGSIFAWSALCFAACTGF